MKWIDEINLTSWANKRECQDKFPELIRRLILSSVKNINDINMKFPSGDYVFYPGLDGEITFNGEDNFIPKGKSFWEMGCSKNVKNKANSDYKKRMKEYSKKEASNYTFVFVTPRVFEKKEDWLKEKKAECFWKDIVVFDAIDLVEWIKRHSRVGLWLSKKLKKIPEEGVESLEDWWGNWSNFTKPPFTKELVISGREEQFETIKNWLDGKPSKILIKSNSTDEAIAFLAATIFSLSQKEKEFFISKALIVKNKETFIHIRDNFDENMIIVFDSDEEIPINNQNYVYKIDNSIKSTIDLSKCKKDALVESLINFGKSKDEAKALVKESYRTISILRRLLKSDYKKPKWISEMENDIDKILVTLFIGGWNFNNKHDKKIIEEFSGVNYDEFEKTITKLLKREDSPIQKIDNLYRVKSIMDLYDLLFDYISPGFIEKFKIIFNQVLGEKDPYLSENYTEEKNSEILRKGIIEILTVINFFNSKNRICDYLDERVINNMVFNLLDKANWERWYSLEKEIPVIAEASPKIFLEVIDESLKEENSEIMKLFKPNKGYYKSTYPSLLWGLERIAYESDYLLKVSLILSKMSRLDPGDNIANRPINSLKEIFLLWYPQTYANLDERMNILKVIKRKEPEVSWDLLLGILPKQNQIIVLKDKPSKQILSKEGNFRAGERFTKKTIDEIFKMLFDLAKNNVNKFIQLIDVSLRIKAILGEEFLKKTIENIIDNISALKGDISCLRNKLRNILCNNKRFPEKYWSLSFKLRELIETLYCDLEPNNVLEKYKWLFNGNICLVEGYKNFEDFNLKINIKRKNAIDEIINSNGIHGIISFSKIIKNPDFLGRSLSYFNLEESKEKEILNLILCQDKKVQAMVHGYIYNKKNNLDWIKEIIKKLYNNDKNKIIKFLECLILNNDLLEYINDLPEEIQKEYWVVFNVNNTSESLSIENYMMVLEKLLQNSRYNDILSIINVNEDKTSKSLIIELLKNIGEKDFRTEYVWEIGNLLNKLEEKYNVEIKIMEELEKINLKYLVNIDSSRQPKYLFIKLSKEPEFFIEILEELKNNESRIELFGKNIYKKFLNDWNILPGQQGEKIEFEILKKWVDNTKKLAEKKDLLYYFYHYTSWLFSYFLDLEKEYIIPEEICRILDYIDKNFLYKEFQTSIFNRRGVYSKSLFEGGKQEYKIANKFEIFYEKIKYEYIELSKVFKNLSEIYKNQGKEEDIGSKILDSEYN